MFIHTAAKSWRNSRAASNFSGDTAPTISGTYAVWYDTATNYIKYTNDGGVNWITIPTALPICTFTRTNGTASSIDQVFNGFGYIGSTAFALPGVKGLFPNGRNEDGTLKTREFVNPAVRIHNVSGTYSVKLCLATSGIGAYFYAYDEVKNAIYRTDTGAYYDADRLIVGDISYSNGIITSLQLKTTFHALDYSDKAEIAGWNMPSNKYIDLTLGASNSTYTAPANGYFSIMIKIGTSQGFLLIRNESNILAFQAGEIAGQYVGFVMPAKQRDEVLIGYNNRESTAIFRFVYAEGEE